MSECPVCHGNQFVRTADGTERCARCIPVEYDQIDKPRHYVEGGGIEPLDFIESRGLNYFEGNIVKYVSRYKKKGGVEDLEKARYYLNRLIEQQTKKTPA